MIGGEFLAGRLSELWLRTGEHIMLTAISTGFAMAIGVPLGILASRAGRVRGVLLGGVSVLQTIPSLAMLAILLALLQKIGTLPAVIALILYALLPIVRNTLTGLEGVSPGVMEAARGVGMTERQQLWMVRLRLAAPVIVSGIRTAAVIGVGIATLSAFIGAGGLGQFINRGLALSSTPLILLGAVPAAVLALLVDLSIGAAEWGLKPTRQRERRRLTTALKPVAVALPLFLAAAGLLAYKTGSSGPPIDPENASKPKIRVASKNFTEQIILGELVAQLIEAEGSFAVERRFNLGGTMICHGALIAGEVDVYAEYTGTGLIAILKMAAVADPAKALAIVRREYRRRFDLEWLDPLGFNNTYAITVREVDAAAKGWTRISDLAAEAGNLRAGFTAEFGEREDGYRGLRAKYGFGFVEVRDLDPAIMYDAVAKGEVDAICAFATDGRIAAYKLRPLADDLGYFPPYQAALVVRREVLERWPGLRAVLAPLEGILSDAAMQRLNYEVDGKGRRPARIAKRFLKERGLL